MIGVYLLSKRILNSISLIVNSNFVTITYLAQ